MRMVIGLRSTKLWPGVGCTIIGAGVMSSLSAGLVTGFTGAWIGGLGNFETGAPALAGIGPQISPSASTNRPDRPCKPAAISPKGQVWSMLRPVLIGPAVIGSSDIAALRPNSKNAYHSRRAEGDSEAQVAPTYWTNRFADLSVSMVQKRTADVLAPEP